MKRTARGRGYRFPVPKDGAASLETDSQAVTPGISFRLAHERGDGEIMPAMGSLFELIPQSARRMAWDEDYAKVQDWNLSFRLTRTLED